MKFHTQFRPGDLVRDRKTGDEGIIIEAQAIWRNKYGMVSYWSCTERKRPGSTYLGGHYGIFSKTPYGSLNGYWFSDDQTELVKKGFYINEGEKP